MSKNWKEKLILHSRLRKSIRTSDDWNWGLWRKFSIHSWRSASASFVASRLFKFPFVEVIATTAADRAVESFDWEFFGVARSSSRSFDIGFLLGFSSSLSFVTFICFLSHFFAVGSSVSSSKNLGDAVRNPTGRPVLTLTRCFRFITVLNRNSRSRANSTRSSLLLDFLARNEIGSRGSRARSVSIKLSSVAFSKKLLPPLSVIAFSNLLQRRRRLVVFSGNGRTSLITFDWKTCWWPLPSTRPGHLISLLSAESSWVR